MAKSGDFTYTNKTATTYKTLALYDMGEVANYGLKSETAQKVSTINAASDADAREQLSYFCSSIPEVRTSLSVQNPSSLAVGNAKWKGIQYGIILEAIHKTVDSADATYRVDRPVRLLIQLQHEDAATITTSELMDLIGRGVSALIKANGNSRIPDLRASALRVTES